MPMPRNHVSLTALVLVLALPLGAGCEARSALRPGARLPGSSALPGSAGQELVLQVSGAASFHTRITVTPAPPAAH
jgi:hypothetical protein